MGQAQADLSASLSVRPVSSARQASPASCLGATEPESGPKCSEIDMQRVAFCI